MTLEEKILSITSPSLESTRGLLPTDEKLTMDNLFTDFIKPRLPDENVVKAWHKLLMEYTDETNLSSLSCCVRYGNNGSPKISDYGESKYKKLRRGWLTQNTVDNFEYFLQIMLLLRTYTKWYGTDLYLVVLTS